MAQLSTLTSELVGRRYPEFKFVVTRLWVQDYKRALAYSEQDILDDSLIPATFVSCFRDGEFSAFASLEIELSQLLHASQHYTFHEPLKIGDLVAGQTSISRVLSKKGKSGELVFMDFTNKFRRQARGSELESGEGPLVAESVMSVVVRAPVR